MKKNYNYILFDWDGCLAKTLQIHLDAYKDTFAEYDIFPTDVEVTKQVFGDWNGPAKLGVEDVPTFTDAYLARVVQHFAEAPLYPHALETVKKLKKAGKKIALVTTSTVKLIKPALKKTKMEKYFEFVLAAEDVKEHKPAPEIINKSLAKWKAPKEESIIIGDSKSDLGAANNAKIDAVLFSPKDHDIFYDEKELTETYKPTFVIDDHKELLDILV